jgi:hypothetical protein
MSPHEAGVRDVRRNKNPSSRRIRARAMQTQGEWRMANREDCFHFATRYSLLANSSLDPIEGSGTPTDASSILRACGRGSPLRTSLVCEGGTEGGSPVGVPPRLLPTGVSPRALLQARLPGTRVRRALPALACPSPVEAPHAPVVMPADMMPKAARERTVSFRARAPHSLRIREYPRPKASLDEQDSPLVTERGTDVKGNVA